MHQGAVWKISTVRSRGIDRNAGLHQPCTLASSHRCQIGSRSSERPVPPNRKQVVIYELLAWCSQITSGLENKCNYHSDVNHRPVTEPECCSCSCCSCSGLFLLQAAWLLGSSVLAAFQRWQMRPSLSCPLIPCL